MAGSLGMAATMQPFRSSSMAGQRLVAKNASVVRPSSVRTAQIQCRSLEAGAEEENGILEPLICGACQVRCRGCDGALSAPSNKITLVSSYYLRFIIYRDRN